MGLPATVDAPLLGMVYQEIQRQASVMAFVDDFRLIAYIFFFLTPLAFVMRRQKTSRRRTAAAT